MKKQVVALALISGLAFTTAASANWGKGGRGGGPHGDCMKMQGQMSQQLDDETRDKVRQFLKDNQEIRKEMTMIRAEKRALMQSDTPDAKEVARVAGELFDLRTALHEKAELAGVDKYIGPGRMGFGGPGSGRGGRGHHRNFGPQ